MTDSIAMPWNTPQVTRCGRIKIGRLGKPRLTKLARNKRRDQLTDDDYWQPPIKLDRILITHDHRDETGNFAPHEEIMVALGATRENPLSEVPIEVHSDHIPDVLACRLARYKGRKQLACSGDGETAQELRGNEWVERACPCEKSTLVNEGGDCKPNAVFACSLRVPGHRVIGAVFEFRTTSAISIQRLTGSLREVQSAVGTLRGLPLTMALRRVELSNGKAPVWCMHVELREASVEEAMAGALDMIKARNAVIAGTGRIPPGFRALPPGSEDDEETAMVVQEFYPAEAVESAQVSRVDEQPLASVCQEPEQTPEETQDAITEGDISSQQIDAEHDRKALQAELDRLDNEVAAEFTDGNIARARIMIGKRSKLESIDVDNPEHLRALIGAASALLQDAPPAEPKDTLPF